jgi:hypothetical protein
LKLPKQDFGSPEEITVKSVPHVAVENATKIGFGSQVSMINASLEAIAKQGASNVAAGIEKLSDAVVESAELREDKKGEALDVIAEIAKQAEAETKARSKGIVKALMAGFPAVIGKAPDLLKTWDMYGPTLKEYFGF